MKSKLRSVERSDVYTRVTARMQAWTGPLSVLEVPWRDIENRICALLCSHPQRIIAMPYNLVRAAFIRSTTNTGVPSIGVTLDSFNLKTVEVL